MSEKKINILVDIVRLLIIVLISGVLVSSIIFMVSEDPWLAIYSVFVGPFESMRRIGNIVEAASPLMFTALAVIIIFKSGQFSMIAEGSFFIGAKMCIRDRSCRIGCDFSSRKDIVII